MGYTWKYYDLVLAGMAVAMLAGVAIGLYTSVALPIAIVIAGGVTILVMGHAMFVNGPVDEPSDLTQEVDGLN